MDRWMDGHTDRQMDGQLIAWLNRIGWLQAFSSYFYLHSGGRSRSGIMLRTCSLLGPQSLKTSCTSAIFPLTHVWHKPATSRSLFVCYQTADNMNHDGHDKVEEEKVQNKKSFLKRLRCWLQYVWPHMKRIKSVRNTTANHIKLSVSKCDRSVHGRYLYCLKYKYMCAYFATCAQWYLFVSHSHLPTKTCFFSSGQCAE